MTFRQETCKYCGNPIAFIQDNAKMGGVGSYKTGWVVLNAGTLSRHQCEKKAAKVYTPEEKAEFARRRLAGEI